MYFYYTFCYFIYRICIGSIQHTPGRYIEYAHSSCCSVHPFKRSILERHGIVYTCWKYTFHNSSSLGCFLTLLVTSVLWLLEGVLSNWGEGNCQWTKEGKITVDRVSTCTLSSVWTPIPPSVRSDKKAVSGQRAGAGGTSSFRIHTGKLTSRDLFITWILLFIITFAKTLFF